jgi:hypothetical protein
MIFIENKYRGWYIAKMSQSRKEWWAKRKSAEAVK